MKKLLGIVVLGLSLTLLSSCGTTYESFQNSNPGHNYYAYACPASKPNIIDGCGLAADYTEAGAKEGALEVCGRRYNDCMVFKVNNKNVYQEIIAEKNELSLASMMEGAKSTCKGLGFAEGTDKFADCSLKLYSQSIELAAKSNQQVQNMSGGVVTIYDPVRDSNALIRQGQRMINGSCTLGVNC